MDKYNLILDNTKFDMDLIWQIIDLKKEMPYIFYERMKKLSFYFMFPYSIWSKSGTSRNFVPLENIEADMNRYQDNDCAMYFELENVDVPEKVLSDRYSNLVLDNVKDKEAYTVVFDHKLADYIKQNYPKIKLVQSEIKRNLYVDKPFDLNIIDYISFKNNYDKLYNKEEYILAVNSFCKNSYRCSNMLSNNKYNYGIDRPVQCNEKKNTFAEMKKNELFVSLEDMNKINEFGIETFLVKANCDDRFEILETYLYYLIKPEYINAVRLRLMKACFVKR